MPTKIRCHPKRTRPRRLSRQIITPKNRVSPSPGIKCQALTSQTTRRPEVCHYWIVKNPQVIQGDDVNLWLYRGYRLNWKDEFGPQHQWRLVHSWYHHAQRVHGWQLYRPQIFSGQHKQETRPLKLSKKPGHEKNIKNWPLQRPHWPITRLISSFLSQTQSCPHSLRRLNQENGRQKPCSHLIVQKQVPRLQAKT